MVRAQFDRAHRLTAVKPNTWRWFLREHRHVRLFRNGRNQAVRIPVEFKLPGDEPIMHRDGDRLVVEPLRKRRLVAMLKTMKPLDEEFLELDDPVPPPKNIL
jgi:antitoxin VapB